MPSKPCNVFEADIGQSPRVYCTDNGGEFTSTAWRDHLRDNYTRHEYTAPYTPHQNGFCERQWRTIFEGVRVMLTHSGAPPALWPNAAQNMVHIRNRVINKGLHCTPYEALHAARLVAPARVGM